VVDSTIDTHQEQLQGLSSGQALVTQAIDALHLIEKHTKRPHEIDSLTHLCSSIQTTADSLYKTSIVNDLNEGNISMHMSKKDVAAAVNTLVKALKGNLKNSSDKEVEITFQCRITESLLASIDTQLLTLTIRGMVDAMITCSSAISHINLSCSRSKTMAVIEVTTKVLNIHILCMFLMLSFLFITLGCCK
jgi:K+-sensing histidine kinase KdpD